MGTTVAILYGVEIREEGDPVVHAVCAAMEQFSKNFMPGAVLADWLPLPQSVCKCHKWTIAPPNVPDTRPQRGFCPDR